MVTNKTKKSQEKSKKKLVALVFSVLVLIFTILVFLNFYRQEKISEKQAQNESKWLNYKNEEFKFSVDYPNPNLKTYHLNDCAIGPSTPYPHFPNIIEVKPGKRCADYFTVEVFSDPPVTDAFEFWKIKNEQWLNGNMNCDKSTSTCYLNYSHEGESFTAEYYWSSTIVDGKKRSSYSR